MVKPIPEGYHTATPYLTVKGCGQAIDYYKKAFNAQEVVRMADGDRIMHAEIKIGDSMIMLAEEFPGQGQKSPASLGGTATSVFLYITDVDKVYKSAIDAGGKSDMAPENMFWGDRFAKLTDPFGHAWAMATHVEDVTPDEMKKRQQAWMAQMAATAKK